MHPWPAAALSPLQPPGSQDDLWLLKGKRRRTKSQIQWSEEEWDEDQALDLELDWSLEYLSGSPELSQELLPPARLPSRAAARGPEQEATSAVVVTPLQATTAQRFDSLVRRRARETSAKSETSLRRHRPQFGHSLWEMRYGHLPRFLRFFVIQNWFKKLFPIFTLEVSCWGRGRGFPGSWLGPGPGRGRRGRASALCPGRRTRSWAQWTAWPRGS